MSAWLMSANPSRYNHSDAFLAQGYIDWKQTRNFVVGDTVYIYCTKPLSQIRYRTKISKINISPYNDGFWNIDPCYNANTKLMRLELNGDVDSQFLSFTELSKHGLYYPPQGPMRIDGTLLAYIDHYFGGNE